MNVGVIGCGDIAQTMHIPYLIELPTVNLRAVADVIAARAAGIAARYDVPSQYSDGQKLIDEQGSQLDGVVIATPVDQHAVLAKTALDAGLNTFIEKPIAISLENADAVVKAAQESQGIAMIGYNKRYDPSFAAFREETAEMPEFDLVTVYDVDPDHWRIFHEVYDTIGGEVPAELRARSDEHQHNAAADVLETQDEAVTSAFRFHLEHCCHDINVLRALLGEVTAIDYVDVFADGRYATFHLRYDDVRCTVHSGRSDRKWFEETIRVDTATGMACLEFENPFIRNASTKLHVKEGVEEYTERTRIPSYEESFKRELDVFVSCAKQGNQPPTTVAEARSDLRLLVDLFRAYLGNDLLGSY